MCKVYSFFFEFGDQIWNLEICGSLVNLILVCKAKATCNSPPDIFPSCVMSGYKCHNQVLSLRTESISGTNVTIEYCPCRLSQFRVQMSQSRLMLRHLRWGKTKLQK